MTSVSDQMEIFLTVILCWGPIIVLDVFGAGCLQFVGLGKSLGKGCHWMVAIEGDGPLR